MTVGVDDYPYASGHGDSANPGDEGIGLCSHLAYANGFGLGGHTFIAYVDIVTACREAEACIIAQCHVERTGCIIMERILTVGGVVAPGCVAKERALTAGRAIIAGCIAMECINTVGRVVESGCVTIECIRPLGRVVVAIVIEERLKTRGRVTVASIICEKRGHTGGGVLVAVGVFPQRTIT